MSSLLAHGRFGLERMSVVRRAARDAGLSVVESSTSDEAERLLASEEVAVILLGSDEEEDLRVAIEARTRAHHRHVPILAAVGRPTDLSFVTALSFGIDDLVSLHDERELLARLRAVVRAPGPPSAARRGVAVIGEQDQHRRIALARVFDGAGFEVRFALSPEEARTQATDLRVGLLVLSHDLCLVPASLARQAKTVGAMSRLIVTAASKEVPALVRELGEFERVRVLDAASPPENAVYLANEMSVPEMANKRATPRFLFGTTVRFRPEGSEDGEDVGFSYNVSERGLYVRTLAPPTQEWLWLELAPPHASRRVRLVGQVMWRRPFGRDGHATVPPGFGLRIVDGSSRDLAAWAEGFAASRA